jgi:hypothetical protein
LCVDSAECHWFAAGGYCNTCDKHF